MADPTRTQLVILRILWDRGPSTVREVHHALAKHRDTGYTTTLKLMQIMAKEGLVTRDELSRTHVYTARVSQARTQHRLLSDLIERAFGGSASALVLRALSTRAVSSDELQKIREVIDGFAERRRRHD